MYVCTIGHNLELRMAIVGNFVLWNCAGPAPYKRIRENTHGTRNTFMHMLGRTLPNVFLESLELWRAGQRGHNRISTMTTKSMIIHSFGVFFHLPSS